MRSPPSSDCSHLSNPNPYTVGLAAFILVGILVSYLPQHIKIITRRSSEGLSPWWVLLGGLSSIAAIGNILVLPRSRSDIACCKVVKGGECAAALLGVGQIGLQWTCFMFIVLLFLIFFPTKQHQQAAADLDSSTPSVRSITKSAPPKRRDAIIVGITILLSLLIVGIVSIAMIAAYPSRTQTWADALGTLAGVLSAIQYLPQIYFTYTLGSIGSLSIITLLIQVPGAFLFAFSLGLRVGWEGWSTWLVYIVTGILQSVVLAMAIRFWMQGRRQKGDIVEGVGRMVDETEPEGEGTEADESTGLLNGHHKNSSAPRRDHSSAASDHG